MVSNWAVDVAARMEETLRPVPGLRAWQSAQMLFPATFCTSSVSCFSLRACWRLLNAPAMFGGETREGSARMRVVPKPRTRRGCYTAEGSRMGRNEKRAREVDGSRTD